MGVGDRGRSYYWAIRIARAPASTSVPNSLPGPRAAYRGPQAPVSSHSARWHGPVPMVIAEAGIAFRRGSATVRRNSSNHPRSNRRAWPHPVGTTLRRTGTGGWSPVTSHSGRVVWWAVAKVPQLGPRKRSPLKWIRWVGCSATQTSVSQEISSRYCASVRLSRNAVTKTSPAVQPANNRSSSERRLGSTGPCVVTASTITSQSFVYDK